MSSNSSEILNYLITKLPNTGQESSFLFYFKLFSFLIIIIITFSFGLLPLFFANYRQGLIVLNYANPFSGGIFIGIGLFHLLPDASYNFEQYYKTPEGKKCFFYGFPMSYFIVFLSYSFILYLEKVAFSSEERDLNSDLLTNKEIIEPFIKKQKEKNEKEIEKIHDDEINDEKLIPPIMYKRKNSYTETINKKDKVKEIANIISNQKEKIFELDDEYASLIQVKNDKENNNNDKINEEEKNDKEKEKEKEKNTLTPYVLLMALSLHGIFEGIALGVLNSNSECIVLFIAIIAHKWAESFALGISFYNAGIQNKIFIEMLTIFTFFTPVGILIGMYFSKSGLLIEGIMLSISSGTFIYVSTSEVIVEEFSSKGSKYLKFLFYIMGGLLTVLLNILEPTPISY